VLVVIWDFGWWVRKILKKKVQFTPRYMDSVQTNPYIYIYIYIH
jgi:hypothetical protein